MTQRVFKDMCAKYTAKAVVRVLNNSVRALANRDENVRQVYVHWMGIIERERRAAAMSQRATKRSRV